jgi:hypothetical protein
MTLLLGRLNRRQAVLVSDRRLSVDGRVTEDESNKADVFVGADGRLAIAFTGLAKAGSFVTNRWLLGAFTDAAEPDYMTIPTIERVPKIATAQFKTLNARRPGDKCLSVLCAGYVYGADRPRGVLALISNYERLDGQLLALPGSKFTLDIRVESVAESNPTAALVVGMDRAVGDDDITSLRRLVVEDKPADAVVGKAVEVLRAAADSAEARNTIGKQCTSIVLPSNPKRVLGRNTIP